MWVGVIRAPGLVMLTILISCRQGYGYHSDFVNGWNMTVATLAMSNCLAGTDDNGQISACPYLQASDTDGYASNCPVRTSPVNETVTGLLDKLPGCITVTDDPAGAPLASMVCASSVTPPYVTPTSNSVAQVTVQPAVGEVYPEGTFQQFIGCYNDSYAGQRALDGATTTSDTGMDVATCQAHCNSVGYRLSGVEYSTQCCE